MPQVGTHPNALYAGYVQAGAFTVPPARLAATWATPALTAAGPEAVVFIWPGMLVASERAVIQAGTAHVISGQSPDSVYNFAWLAFVGDPTLPGFNDDEQFRALPISAGPGESVTVTLIHEGDDSAGLGIYRVDYTNTTTGASGSWHFPTHLAASNPVMLWVCEDPTVDNNPTSAHVPSPHFGTIHFTECVFTPAGGGVNPMDNLDLYKWYIVPVHQIFDPSAPIGIAVSAIAGDHKSFDCTRDPTVDIPG
jgi:Peptidase A4 family